jgi:hypothetical protein
LLLRARSPTCHPGLMKLSDPEVRCDDQGHDEPSRAETFIRRNRLRRPCPRTTDGVETAVVAPPATPPTPGQPAAVCSRMARPVGFTLAAVPSSKSSFRHRAGVREDLRSVAADVLACSLKAVRMSLASFACGSQAAAVASPRPASSSKTRARRCRRQAGNAGALDTGSFRVSGSGLSRMAALPIPNFSLDISKLALR